MVDVVVGLGNVGRAFALTRHNIGFRILDALAAKYKVEFRKRDNYEYASAVIHEFPILLVKPLTGMNQTGEILFGLQKLGYRLRSFLVVHDELEKEFGILRLKDGGSARGHNGVRSLMKYSDVFWRLQFGIGRPAQKEDVAEYVLEQFTRAEEEQLPALIAEAIQLIELAIVSEKE